MSRILFASAVAALAVSSVGCGDSSEGENAPPRTVAVLTTTTIIADLTREVGGSRVDVRSLSPPSADPGAHDPSAEDLTGVRDALVVLRSGAGLDEWLIPLIEEADREEDTIDLSRSVVLRARPGSDAGAAGTHWWLDPRNVEAATRAIRDALVRRDPRAERRYARRTRRFLIELRSIDRSIAFCMARVPRSRRAISSSDDELHSFAQRYRLLTVPVGAKGPPRPFVVGRGGPSAADRRDAAAGDATIGPQVDLDSLPPGRSYLDSLRETAGKVASALSGRRIRC